MILCPAPLERLFKRSFPDVEVIVQERDPMPEHDVLTALMSLPQVFGTTLGNCPPPARFLVEEKDVGARVGVCWHGGAREEEPIANADDKRRSIPVEVFQPIIDAAGDRVISLQQEHLGTADWLETAEIVAGLDLVITVDTAMAHLAASLGVETWILLRSGGCWRWLTKGDKTVWYPSARLYRQEALSDWRPVVQRVVADLVARRGMKHD
jgi:hypothetical protein